MAAKQQAGVWGIDIGQSALKALRLENLDGTVTATAFDYIEHAKILSQPDADPDALTRQALEQFLSRNPLKGDTLIISVPGQTGLARFVKLPPVEPKKIPDIVKFEAKQQIPFSLDEVTWDWQIIGSKGGEAEGFVENEIGLFAVKRDLVYRSLQAFQDLRVEVNIVQMSPLALCNFITYDVLGKDASPTTIEEGGRQDCVVALDMGVDNTNLVVTDGERIIWQRPIPIGGNHFTRALTKEMKLTFAKAEHLKRNATKAEDPKKIFASMKPVFADFVAELQRSLGFFTNTHRGAHIKKVIGLGNAFRLPGLAKFVGQSLGLELEKVTEFNSLVGDEVKQSPVYADNVLSFPVAYGLALQGMGVTRLKTNLLPQEIRMERFIRAKKPVALTAAASLLLGIGAFAVASGAQFKASDAAFKEAINSKHVIDDAARKKTQFAQKIDTVKQARIAAALIIRGSEERSNWALFYRYLDDCLPQPNGENVPGYPLPINNLNPRQEFYTDNAVRANQAKLDRDMEGTYSSDINLSDLVQIHITSVYARYCDVPMATAFYNNVKSNDTMGQETVEPRNYPDWAKPPAQPGWAVEVRGYTYHRAGHRFILYTLCENLRNSEKKLVRWPLNSPAKQVFKMDASHVALFKFNELADAKRDAPFFWITRPIFLNALVKSTAAATGSSGNVTTGSGGGSMAAYDPNTAGNTGDAAGSRARDDWSGLAGGPESGLGGSSGGGASGGGGAAGGGAPMINMGGGARNPAGGGAGMNVPPPPANNQPPPGNQPAGDAAGAARGDQKRTEFIILLYWVEPLPTEPVPPNPLDAAAAGTPKPQ